MRRHIYLLIAILNLLISIQLQTFKKLRIIIALEMLDIIVLDVFYIVKMERVAKLEMQVMKKCENLEVINLNSNLII